MRARQALPAEQAKANGQDEFIFQGRKLVTNYAKYLIEYLDKMLKE